MWFVFILCGIISGLMFSNEEEVYTNGTCQKIKPDPNDPNVKLKGCPTEIPIVDNGTIVAARIYQKYGFSDIPALACRGGCKTYYAETKYTDFLPTDFGDLFRFGSVIINPGCTIYLFKGQNWTGAAKAFTGPKLITAPTLDWEYTGYCQTKDYECCVLYSIIFTCKQVFPSCTPSDGWQVVTTLDNRGSSIPTTFKYSKTVGTTDSKSMTESKSVSTTVSASLTASFFSYVSATIGLSHITKYDWTKADTETKNKAQTYSVEVTIPGGVMIYIEEAVGTCGGSTFHTQMFRVKDKTNQTVREHQGKITKYKLSKKDFKKKNDVFRI